MKAEEHEDEIHQARGEEAARVRPHREMHQLAEWLEIGIIYTAHSNRTASELAVGNKYQQ